MESNDFKNAEGKTIPFSKEEVGTTETWVAKFLLLEELNRIPEFNELRNKANEKIRTIMRFVNPEVENIYTNLSPEARGVAYQLGLKALLEPLEVPGLADFVKVMDDKKFGTVPIVHQSVAGVASDLLESILIRGLTDLSPAEAMSESPALIRKRISLKIGPLSRRFNSFKLAQRIHFWVRNVVYGDTFKQISRTLENNPGYCPTGYVPDDWVRKQVRQASKILGVKRRNGRPRKGGVLVQWKFMPK